MASKEHTELIEGRGLLIGVYFPDFEEADEDDSIDHDRAASDEEDGSGLIGAGVTEEVEDIQKALKYSSLSSYMLKPSHLVAHDFESNRTAQDKLFKNMCNFGARSKWREWRRVVSSYICVETTKTNSVSSIIRLWIA